VLVEARDLTRYYGDLLAVDHVNLTMDRGEIVGLLGPNGAGKTTTMRMLTSFLPATEGTATVAGYDVRESPVEVKRHIGYLPENNPVYPEMRVEEYLSFRAALKGVARRERERRIDRCSQLCGIGDVRRQVIGTLSMGYRQRVGLADALLGNPDVLILDEPTIGLDPNQVRQTRDTIGQLSEQHTVLLSTHILQEVEALCERVLIIDDGRIVADDSPENLSDRTLQTRTVVELKGNPEAQRASLAELERVKKIEMEQADGWNRFTLATDGRADVRPQVYSRAAENGWGLRELTQHRASLEDVFHRITVEDKTEAAPENKQP
jgi:ABC-2 type transport system ATP-binding protein